MSSPLIQKENIRTQHSSGLLPFLQVPLEFGQGQKQISSESSIKYTVIIEELPEAKLEREPSVPAEQ